VTGPADPPLDRVLVIGAGLIGCSVALALRTAGVADVVLADPDEARLRLAGDLGAGRPLSSGEAGFDVVLIAVPPAATAGVLVDAQHRNLGAIYSDVASIKTGPQRKAESLGVDFTHYVGGHPVAGRERGGPAGARRDLFLGRPWVLCPTTATASDALAAMQHLAQRCGAVPVVLDAVAHDRAMALVSHVPQALASALAAELRAADEPTVGLAGSGLRDLTRIADSDPELWAQIAGGNPEPIADVLDAVAGRLAMVAATLREGPDAGAAFGALVADGNAGRARLPGKHGARPTAYAVLPVVIVDEPGILARLLSDAGAAGINVEDLSLEHSPGALVGLCELVVAPDQADHLAAVLEERGWTVHPPSAPVVGR
jgi:prephenate dehydrogenase